MLAKAGQQTGATEAQVRAFMTAADTDGDGQVSFPEFLEFCQKYLQL